MAINVHDPLVTVVMRSLQQYVVANPDATVEDMIAVIMSFDQPLEIAQEAIGLTSQKFDELAGRHVEFEEIKAQAIAAAALVPDEIDMSLL